MTQLHGKSNQQNQSDQSHQSISSDIDSETLTWLADDSWNTLPPYDWGEEGVPEGKPVRYVPGVGLVVEGGKPLV